MPKISQISMQMIWLLKVFIFSDVSLWNNALLAKRLIILKNLLVAFSNLLFQLVNEICLLLLVNLHDINLLNELIYSLLLLFFIILKGFNLFNQLIQLVLTLCVFVTFSVCWYFKLFLQHFHLAFIEFSFSLEVVNLQFQHIVCQLSLVFNHIVNVTVLRFWIFNRFQLQVFYFLIQEAHLIV